MTAYSPQELVSIFAAEARRAFGFLESSFGTAAELEIQVSAEHGTRPVDLVDEGEGHYLFATLTYAGPALRVEVTYGDRECVLAVRVGPTGAGSPPVMYGLAEWREALGVEGGAFADPMYVTSADALRDAVDRTAADTYQLLGAMLAAGPDIISRLETRRAERLGAQADEMTEREHRHIGAQAAAAFRVRDYATVVRLLSRLETRLTPAERKQLELARARSG